MHLTLLREHLLHLGQADSQAATHWRFALMANSLLLMLMPPHTPHQAATLTRHLFSLMQHQLSSQRTLGGMAMLYLLNPQPTWATVCNFHPRLPAHSWVGQVHVNRRSSKEDNKPDMVRMKI